MNLEIIYSLKLCINEFEKVYANLTILSKASHLRGELGGAYDLVKISTILETYLVEYIKDRCQVSFILAKYGIIHFGFPCITWSRARTLDNKGPPPLRGDTPDSLIRDRCGQSRIRQPRHRGGGEKG